VRRSDKEIRDPAGISALLDRAEVLRLAMIGADGWPYVVPVCFGFSDGEIFVHGAREGRKMEALRADPRVCFEADLDVELRPGDGACKWSMAFRSVIGFGEVDIPEDPEDKRRGLDAIMAHYGADGPHAYPDAALRSTEVLRIRILSVTGKRGGYETDRSESPFRFPRKDVPGETNRRARMTGDDRGGAPRGGRSAAAGSDDAPETASRPLLELSSADFSPEHGQRRDGERRKQRDSDGGGGDVGEVAGMGHAKRIFPRHGECRESRRAEPRSVPVPDGDGQIQRARQTESTAAFRNPRSFMANSRFPSRRSGTPPPSVGKGEAGE
jgi:uncharacterized protein